MISIIVPVYNVEPYLCRCLDSILKQSYSDFELILVDDGSPDNCPAICDEYAAQDSRVRVIHQKNSGLSAARNAGLDIASGKYILFCDSDDCVCSTWCQSLIAAACTEQNNFIYGTFQICYEGSSIPDTAIPMPKAKRSNLNAVITEHINSKIGFACNALFYTDILRKKHIRFRQDVIIEDLPFCLDYLKEMQFLSYCPDACYYYMQRQEETLSRKYHQDGFRKWQEKYAMLQTFVDQKIPSQEQEESRKLLANFYLYFFLDALNNTFDSRSTLSWRQKMCYNQKAMRSEEFQHCLRYCDGARENPKYLALLKKGNYYAAYLYVCAAKIKSHLKR